MRVSGLFTDEDAVSSVIGVVLMVAVTIVLSAAVATFVLEIGVSSTNAQPSATYYVEWDAGNAAGSDSIEFEQGSGDAIEADTLEIKIGGSTAWTGSGGPRSGFTATSQWSGTVRSGDAMTVGEAAGTDSIQDGDRILVLWTRGDDSQILADRTVST